MMRKTLLTIILLLGCFYSCDAQSTDLKEEFSEIRNIFKEYSIKSEKVWDKNDSNYYTNKFNVYFKYPNLVIEFYESLRNGGFNIGLEEGKHKISIPIIGTNIRLQELFDLSFCSFKNEEGVLHLYNGKKNLTQEYKFIMDILVGRKIAKHFNSFQNLVIKENFKGNLGIYSKKRNISGLERKRQTSKSGRYGQ